MKKCAGVSWVCAHLVPCTAWSLKILPTARFVNIIECSLDSVHILSWSVRKQNINTISARRKCSIPTTTHTHTQCKLSWLHKLKQLSQSYCKCYSCLCTQQSAIVNTILVCALTISWHRKIFGLKCPGVIVVCILYAMPSSPIQVSYDTIFLPPFSCKQYHIAEIIAWRKFLPFSQQ